MYDGWTYSLSPLPSWAVNRGGGVGPPAGRAVHSGGGPLDGVVPSDGCGERNDAVEGCGGSDILGKVALSRGRAPEGSERASPGEVMVRLR